MMNDKRFLILSIAYSFVVCLHGQIANFDDENGIHYNYSTLWDLLKPHSNPLLFELNGHWSFNDSIDISKYEDFDLSKFENSKEMTLEELMKLINDKNKLNNGALTTENPEDLPEFDNDLVTNISVQLGATAYFHCRVRNLNNRAVSWVRRRDWHILTSATFTYTNDERFHVVHAEGSDDWTLKIRFVQKRDSGAYECQVSTGKSTISRYFNLNVIVPTAYILGTGEYHIGQGSTISLVCIIENSPEPMEHVMWYHNDKLINERVENSSGLDGHAQVITEFGVADDRTHSRLLVTDTTQAHSGNYTCTAMNADPDSVYVFVSSDGDNIAAIQRHNAQNSRKPIFLLILLSLSFWSIQ